MKNQIWNHPGALGLALAGCLLCLLLNACSGLVTSTSGGGGGGGTPAASTSPGSLTFASQTVNTTSAAQSVTLTNSGSAALSLTSVAITGTNSGDFAETNTCGGSVNANASCTVSVTFTPTAAGSRTAAVSITDNATGSPQTVSLTGTGASAGGNPAVSLSPTSLTFASQTVNTTSAAQTVTLTNSGTAALSITSIAITGTSSGDFAETNTCGSSVNAGANCTISVTFTPTATGSRTANISITDNASGSPQTVSLTGTGTNATTVANVIPAALAFGNVTVNTTSAAQTVTVTNGGTTTFTVNTVTTAAPFAVSGFSAALPATLSANQSLTFQVTFAPTVVAASNGSVTITYSAAGLSNSTVSLSGTGTSVGGGTLAISTTTLPDATSSANYIAILQASGGSGTLTWSLASGSALPSGLTLDSATGVIFGTAPSTGGTSNFTVQVSDSKTTVSAALSITTSATTNAVCNDVYIDTGAGVNPPATPVPVALDGILNGPHILPLNDLGTKGGTYNGQAGGLYPNGTNVRPATYDATGVSLAGQIQPLDSTGKSCTGTVPSCSYVLITIGMSNTNIESFQFVTDAAADTAVNHSQLVIVNAAHNSADATSAADLNSTYWTTDIPSALSTAGVTGNQVVAAWVKEALKNQAGGAPNFPADAQTLQSKYETIAQNLKTKFPNIKLAYYSSRIYAGYAGTGDPLNPEYVAYESGFGVKFAVEDSINGKVANAPWMAWGPYLWANGMLPRSDGTVWSCQNLSSDGTHPSGSGAKKVSGMLLNFFKTDSTTKGWFCATGACP